MQHQDYEGFFGREYLDKKNKKLKLPKLSKLRINRTRNLYALENQGIVTIYNSHIRGLEKLARFGLTKITFQKNQCAEIPPEIYSKLAEQNVILGLGNFLEIWAKEKLEKYESEKSQDFRQIAEQLFKDLVA
jgi:hypothetical protein